MSRWIGSTLHKQVYDHKGLKITQETIQIEFYIEASRCKCIQDKDPSGFGLAEGPDLVSPPPVPDVVFNPPESQMRRVFIVT